MPKCSELPINGYLKTTDREKDASQRSSALRMSDITPINGYLKVNLTTEEFVKSTIGR